MAGGIAHDFNNLLVSILGNADLALMEMSALSPARKSTEEIKKAAIRASELTNQMLAYSGKGRFIIKAINLNELVEEMAHLLEVSLSKKTVLKYDFADNLPAVEADPAQLRQVVMNLITNAADAIGDKSGVITVSTGVMEADEAYLTTTYLDEALPPGYYTYLEVSDTGCGMDEDIRVKLFDPFFTTKFAGRGLGLAAVLGIIRGHQGAIKVYSEPGRGTAVKVLLPCSNVPIEPEKELGIEVLDDWKASGTVLFIDDEETVRNVTKIMLEKCGLDVITAEDGRKGIEAYSENADKIDLVLLDMTMPHMDGEETFRELRKIHKDVRVILCSGYSEQDATTRFAGKGLADFVQKPFRIEILLEKIRGALGSTS